ncbi:hypothetical protein SAMN04488132_101408 [Sediminibacterium ginsengisoli]|uniref:Uncharacterized protein n=1 Tax=Sediminibacterium ginsengisoli TaxID=413434 RepID=A0A1T4K2N7_9BACT|nr:hypothetical protein SAMN04488132_101408 [Sediminibacterium ginsengisoli]
MPIKNWGMMLDQFLTITGSEFKLVSPVLKVYRLNGIVPRLPKHWQGATSPTSPCSMHPSLLHTTLTSPPTPHIPSPCSIHTLTSAYYAYFTANPLTSPHRATGTPLTSAYYAYFTANPSHLLTVPQAHPSPGTNILSKPHITSQLPPPSLVDNVTGNDCVEKNFPTLHHICG